MQQVTLDSVSKVYDRIFALHRVSMTFRAGEVTALVGDNGSGKTTLLTILATLEAPTRGEIAYDDVDWEGFAAHYRDRVGWIAHDSLLYPELDGRENLSFYARMYGLDDVPDRVNHWLDAVGLTEAADRRVSTYSRGMRQRLSIARSLLQDPDLLLLDEPLTGLDRGGRLDVVRLIQSLREQKKIIITSSHDLSALDDITDRLAVLRKGKLTHFEPLGADDIVAELYRTHAGR